MMAQIGRLFGHRWRQAALPRHSLSGSVLARLGERVRSSELRHSGEIRVYVEAGLPLSDLWRAEPLDQTIRARAVTQFSQLRVWDTAHNNGVLVYLLLAERSIELVADRGLMARVPSEVWQALVTRMATAFKQDAFEAGLAGAIDEVTLLLCQHFALAPGDANPNELPDQPVLG